MDSRSKCLAMLCALAVFGAKAQVTGLVQNASFSFVSDVQTTNAHLKRFSINTKTIIEFLKGASIATTGTVTNDVITVTNDPGLPQGAAVGAPFTLTDYTVNIAGGTFTNGVQFTNDVVFSLISSTPVTYTFPNTVEIPSTVTGFPSDVTAYIFTERGLASAPQITAVQQPTSDGSTAFTLIGTSEGSVTQNIPTTFESSPRIIAKITSGSETYHFFIRDGSGGEFVDYDISGFLQFAPIAKVSQRNGSTSNDLVRVALMMTNTPLQFDADAIGKQLRTTNSPSGSNPGGVFVRSLTASCLGSGSVTNQLLVQPSHRPPAGPLVFSGRFNMNGGRFETFPSP